jgi:hypothetical protein
MITTRQEPSEDEVWLASAERISRSAMYTTLKTDTYRVSVEGCEGCIVRGKTGYSVDDNIKQDTKSVRR